MIFHSHLPKNLILGFVSFFVFACNSLTEKDKQTVKTDLSSMETKPNPVVYFEIPVSDMERAIKFYKLIFRFDFEKEIIDKNEMALFPFSDNARGISGALAKGEIYEPTKNGVVIYFDTKNIDSTLKLVIENGGKILFPKTSNGDLGFVGEFEDSEGNRIALHQSIKK